MKLRLILEKGLFSLASGLGDFSYPVAKWRRCAYNLGRNDSKPAAFGCVTTWKGEFTYAS